MEKSWSVNVSYLLLLLVMGGRTALFVSRFDSLFKIPGFGLTPLSIVLALALILAVSAGAYIRGNSNKNERKRSTATWVMFGAAGLDGWFNVSEAIILAEGSGAFDQFAGTYVIYWMWLTAILVGVGPTLLTMGLASLSGELSRTTSQEKTTVRTHTKVGVVYEKKTENNASLDAHLTKVYAQLSPGDELTRTQIQNWTGVSKQHAVNIVNYAKQQGTVKDIRRGVYVYSGAVEDKTI